MEGVPQTTSEEKSIACCAAADSESLILIFSRKAKPFAVRSGSNNQTMTEHRLHARMCMGIDH